MVTGVETLIDSYPSYVSISNLNCDGTASNNVLFYGVYLERNDEFKIAEESIISKRMVFRNIRAHWFSIQT